MGAARLKPQENEREIFLSAPRLTYVSPQTSNRPVSKREHREGSPPSTLLIKAAHSCPSVLTIQERKSEVGTCFLLEIKESFLAVKVKTGPERKSPLRGFGGQNPEYAYFFTGKELYEDEALQWYDYGARMYDVQIGRWTTHDPLYQDASPYVFCGNNGIMNIDPTGMNWFTDAWDDIKSNPWKGILGLATGGLGYLMVSNVQGFRMIGFGALALGVGILTGGLGTTVMASAILGGAAGGSVMGGYLGGEIAGAKGANGFAEWATYIGGGMTIGAVAGGLAGATAAGLGTIGASSTFGAFIQGAASGAVGGGLNGMGMTALSGGNDSQIWNATWKGAAIGAVIGGVTNAAIFKIRDLRSNREGMKFAKELDAQGKKLNIQNEADLQKAIEENPHLRKMWERAGRPKLQFDGDYKFRLSQEKVLGYTEPTGNPGELRTCFTNQNNTNAEFYWTAHHEFRHALNARFLGMGFPVGIEHRFMLPRDNWNLKFLDVYF